MNDKVYTGTSDEYVDEFIDRITENERWDSGQIRTEGKGRDVTTYFTAYGLKPKGAVDGPKVGLTDAEKTEYDLRRQDPAFRKEIKSKLDLRAIENWVETHAPEMDFSDIPPFPWSSDQVPLQQEANMVDQTKNNRNDNVFVGTAEEYGKKLKELLQSPDRSGNTVTVSGKGIEMQAYAMVGDREATPTLGEIVKLTDEEQAKLLVRPNDDTFHKELRDTLEVRARMAWIKQHDPELAKQIPQWTNSQAQTLEQEIKAMNQNNDDINSSQNRTQDEETIQTQDQRKELAPEEVKNLAEFMDIARMVLKEQPDTVPDELRKLLTDLEQKFAPQLKQMKALSEKMTEAENSKDEKKIQEAQKAFMDVANEVLPAYQPAMAMADELQKQVIENDRSQQPPITSPISPEPNAPPITPPNPTFPESVEQPQRTKEEEEEIEPPVKGFFTSLGEKLGLNKKDKKPEDDIPDFIKETYTQKGNKFYHKETNELAFKREENACRIYTPTPEVIRDLMEMEAARGATGITIQSAPPEVARQLWFEGNLAGLQVNGYTPTPEEEQQLAGLMQQKQLENAQQEQQLTQPVEQQTPQQPQSPSQPFSPIPLEQQAPEGTYPPPPFPPPNNLPPQQIPFPEPQIPNSTSPISSLNTSTEDQTRSTQPSIAEMSEQQLKEKFTYSEAKKNDRLSPGTVERRDADGTAYVKLDGGNKLLKVQKELQTAGELKVGDKTNDYVAGQAKNQTRERSNRL